MERLGERDRAPAPARVGGQLLDPFPPAVGAQRGDTWSLRDISSMCARVPAAASATMEDCVAGCAGVSEPGLAPGARLHRARMVGKVRAATQ